mgnify:CR=1 FL=1
MDIQDSPVFDRRAQPQQFEPPQEENQEDDLNDDGFLNDFKD